MIEAALSLRGGLDHEGRDGRSSRKFDQTVQHRGRSRRIPEPPEPETVPDLIRKEKTRALDLSNAIPGSHVDWRFWAALIFWAGGRGHCSVGNRRDLNPIGSQR